MRELGLAVGGKMSELGGKAICNPVYQCIALCLLSAIRVVYPRENPSGMGAGYGCPGKGASGMGIGYIPDTRAKMLGYRVLGMGIYFSEYNTNSYQI